MARGSRIAHLLAVITLAVLIIFGWSATATAAVITNWSSVQPVGQVGTNQPVIVQGNARYDGAGLQPASLRLFVDGVAVPRAMFTGSVSSSSVYVYYNPVVKFADGVRTFRVEVSDSAGRLSVRQWSATIAEAPSPVWLSPAAGSTLYSGRPQVSLLLADNTPGTTFTVAGQVRSGGPSGPVAATFGGSALAAGQRDFALSAEIPPGTYYLTASVSDASGHTRALTGATSRSFVVANAPGMTVLESCDSCHATYRSAHPTRSSVDCLVCHQGYDGDHMEGTEYCQDCHWDGWHNNGGRTAVRVTSPCVNCHGSARPEIVRHTAQSTTTSHASQDCSPCHSASLTAEHSVTPAGSAYANQCDLCHGGQASQLVKDAVTAGTTTCSSCHGQADHEAVHTAVRSDSCVDCHEQPSLTAVHERLGCDTCHASADPDVVNAISTGNLQCSACHEEQPHPDLALTHAATMTSQPMVIFENHDYIGQVSWTVNCGMCHASSDLLKIHANDCSACHAGSDPAGTLGTWTKGCQQGACHPGLPHPQADPAHSALESQNCDICHEPSWAVYESTCDSCHDTASTAPPVTTSNVKASYVGSASITLSTAGVAYTFYQLDGEPRRAGSTVSVAGPAAGTVTRTIEYWSVSDAGVEELPHKTATFTIAADTLPPTTTANALPSYWGPATINLSATDNNDLPVSQTYWILDGQPAVAGRTVSVAQPTSGSRTYVLEYWSVDAAGNEEPHKTATFTVNADTTAPTTTSNAAAYYRTTGVTITLTASDPTPGSGLAATYYRVNGGVVVSGRFPYLSGQRSHTLEYWSVDKAGNVETHRFQTIVLDITAPVTTSDAAASYTGPARIRLTATDAVAGVAATYYILDTGTQQTGTQVDVPINGTHTLQFWSVDAAGNAEARKQVTFTVTGGVADTTAPTTTSDAVAEYNGAANITLSAVDTGGSGVARTYYRVDGGAQQTGTSVRVSTAGAHTLEFWSEDIAGNVESHKYAYFTVIAATGSGTITFAWNATPGAYAHYYVHDAQGVLVSEGVGEQALGWNGWFNVTVPVSADPYQLSILWYDPYYDSEEYWSYASALIDVNGKNYTFWY